jgi:CRISPR-associated protein Cmr3
VNGLKTADGYFLTAKGMGIVLAGGIPDDGDYYLAKDLWLEERRVGLTRDYLTRTALDHMLYSVAHVRPVQDLEIEVLESGAEQDWVDKIPKFMRVGGEGRLAEIKVEKEFCNYPTFPQLSTRNNSVNYTVTLITPGCFKESRLVLRNGPEGMPGKCIAACIGKLDVVGGWDLQLGESRPAQPYLPSGSTWFYQAEPGCEELLSSLHGSCVGDKKSFGYAQVLIGTWEGIK